ncbi:AbrB/MazE/SpoVT family DNA-binding domain-containing protein [Candidatus Berkelbacteria bacterium]|nr:AbrB/MazE/SpoVT family DNA-binding domain-containing protein [Candidatus Berkelbacteria bacterium]
MTKVLATLTSKGQMTIPKVVRRSLGLRPGMKIEVELHDRQFIVRPAQPLKILAFEGFLKDRDDGRPTEEIIAIARDRAMRKKFKLRK